jgi:hypothetical protein
MKALNTAVSRKNICELEAVIAQLPDQIDPDAPITHHFAAGVYGRQMDLQKGSVVVGKIHRFDILNIITHGAVRVASEFCSEIITGPKIWVSKAGTKRAIYAIEDTQWITVHANESDTRDLGKIEDFVIAPDYNSLDIYLSEKLECTA